ncbi:ATP-dependent nuclease [Leuconostoc gasicomitatum]|uniref:ATP-dependent nuclease n=1 Tax=Leuconostoc gasicomitatum TaxID=115778 RepID=UPI001CC73DD7|nr:AAA family ATPase [Leuconostoc gasicomitatum]MBZ5981645.1 AAA family ATPase [Leuconostoc gasicomitatum]
MEKKNKSLDSFIFGISRVKIKNFRGIKNADVSFKKNTIIVGRNNVGKSTIISAIFGFSNIKNSIDLNVNNFNIKLIETIFNNRTNLKKLKKEINRWNMFVEIHYKWENVPSYLFDLITSLSSQGEVRVRTIASLNEDLFAELSQETNASQLNKYFIISYEIFDFNLNEWIPADQNNRHLLFPKSNDSIEASQNVYYIKADRHVDNGDSSNNNITGRLFNKRLSSSVDSPSFTRSFGMVKRILNRKLSTDTDDMKQDLNQFSFPNNDVLNLEIIPTFDEWTKNPQVRVSQLYKNLGIEIPINRQGLGYQNIYNILGQLGNSFKSIEKLIKKSGDDRRSVMFIIEEPEVYTHPQMQHVFIQQLVNFINNKNSSGLYIQTLIISHSAEVAVAALDKDNDYQLVRVTTNQSDETIANTWNSDNKSDSRLTSLILNYNAELLFADKVILVEGDSERALITSMMRRLDNDFSNPTTLLTQQIAIVPVGKSIKQLEDSLKQLNFKKLVMFTDLDFGKSSSAKVHDFKDAVTSTSSLIRQAFIGNHQSFQNVFNGSGPHSISYPNSKVPNLKIFTQNWIDSSFLPMTLEPALLNTGNNYDILKKYFTSTVSKNSNRVNLSSKWGGKVNFALDVALLINEMDSKNNYLIDIPEYFVEGLRWLNN